jgi:O-antigen/teichoic acid export membrane protein
MENTAAMNPPPSHRVVHSLAWAAVRIWGNRLGGLVIFFVLARLLTPEAFGVYASLWALLLFLEVFAELGLGDALIQTRAVEQTQLNTAFFTSVLIGLGLYATIWCLAPLFAQLMGNEEIALPLRIAAVGLLLNASGYCQLALYRRNFAYQWLAVRTLVATGISGVLGIVLALLGAGYWALVAQYVVNTLIGTVMLWVRPQWVPTLSFSFATLRPLLPYSMRLTVARVLDNSALRLFEIGIGFFLGPLALGIYSVGSRIISVGMQMFGNVMLDVSHAALSRFSHDLPRMRNAYIVGMQTSATVAMPAFVLVSALSLEICTTVFGAQWADSAPVLHAIAILAAVQVVQYMNGGVLNALGLAEKTMIASIAKGIAALTALIVFYPYGIVTLAIAFAVSQLLITPLSFYFSWRAISWDLRAVVKALLAPTVSALLAYGGIDLLRPELPIQSGWLKLLCLAASGSIIYLAAMLLLAPSHLGSLARSLRSLKKGDKE